MRHSYPFRKRALRLLPLMLLAGVAGACSLRDTAAEKTEPAPKATAKISVDQAMPDFNKFLAAGDYAAAMALVKRVDVPDATRDHMLGDLVLEGLADDKAKSRPQATVADGLGLLETSAASGYPQAISSLRGRFENGINYQGRNQIMSANPALADCWRSAESGVKKPADCISLRAKLKLP